MKIKRESPHFALWDAMGMAAHLEAMEAKGWRFRGTDWLGRWEFEENLAQAVRYAVAYAPSRRDWRIAPTEPEQDLEDLCFDAGWRKIAALSRFHIYRNPDPDATDLETDEQIRLDTLERSLTRPLLTQALLVLLWTVLILGILVWAFRNDLPRALAIPSLPMLIVFALWLVADRLIPVVAYRRWLKKAHLAAESGLPCPPVNGWQTYTWIVLFLSAAVLLGLLTGGTLWLLLVYTAIVLAFYGLRWYLEHRMYDETLAENLFQVSIVVIFFLLFAVNRFYQAANIPEAVPMPLTAQDLVDTTGMDIQTFNMNSSEGPLATYRDYWQPDNNSDFNLRCTVFDLHLPVLETACRDWFLKDFQTYAKRTEQTLDTADPVPWDADDARRVGNSWLIFYDDRVIELHTSWDLTPEQIAAAAAKLAP